MAASQSGGKKVLVASAFEFSKTGADEVIDAFRNFLADPASVPFVSFDENTQTFSFEADVGDKTLKLNLLASVAKVIEHYQTSQPDFDEELRIRPIEGTFSTADVLHDTLFDSQPLLVSFDDESHGQDAPRGGQNLRAYWEPRSRDIDILHRMYADEITRLTATELYAEREEKRYLLQLGDFQLALQKLLTLEPLLEIYKLQQQHQSLRAVGDVLIWPAAAPDARIEYVALRHPHPAYARLIVATQQQTLRKKVIGELRTNTDDQEYESPLNLSLREVSPTSQLRASKIWDGYVCDGFGDVKNMEPVISSQPSSHVSSQLTAVPNTAGARITAWTQKVPGDADPNLPAEAPAEPRRRIVLTDSESDDDEPLSATVPPWPPQAQPESLSIIPPITRTPNPPSSALLSFCSSSPGRDAPDPSQNAVSDMDEAADVHNPNELEEISFYEGQTCSNTTPDLRAGQGHHSPHGQAPSLLSLDHRDLAPRDHSSESSRDPIPSDDPDEQGQSRPNLPVASLMDDTPPHTSTVPSNPRPDRTASQYPPTSPTTMPTFKPRGYGSHSGLHRGQQAFTRGGAAQRGNVGRRGQARENYRAPGPISPRKGQHAQRGNFAPVQRGSQGQRGASTGNRGRPDPPRSREPHNLIDVRTPATKGQPRIPPGFEAQVPLIRQQESLMDQPVPQDLSAGPSPRPQRGGSELSHTSRMMFSDEGSDWAPTTIPKKDLTKRKNEAMQMALEAIKKHQEQKAQNSKAKDDAGPPRHSTMQQRGKNPGNKAAQETKAQKKERLAKAKEAAYGPLPVSKQAAPKAGPDDLSKWMKKHVTKNPGAAALHPELVEDRLRHRQSLKLFNQLEPVFETSRAFPGRLEFEMAFGQVLVIPNTQIEENSLHDLASWAASFDAKPEGGRPTSTFTKLLTTNGADVDRALETKAPVKEAVSKMWNATPTRRTTTYEFSCRSKSNEDFTIAVDQSGKYQLRKDLVAVGIINIHVPAQIWDASAILSGHLTWPNPSETLEKSASAFIDLLHVAPNQSRLAIFFRQPKDSEFEVRNLLIKRVSYHSCSLHQHEDIQLKITEAKSILSKRHHQDKRLIQSYEPPTENYADLAREGRIHYEMSLVHTGINQGLAQNEYLEIGSAMPPESSGKSLISQTVIRLMLDLAVQMVQKIDYIGMQNFGTLLRQAEQEAERRRALELSLGPEGRSILQGQSYMVPGVTGTRTPGPAASAAMTTHASGTQVTTTNNVLPVHGIRMNTEAPIIEDADGYRYRLGMGGAKIPVASNDNNPFGLSPDTIVPDDSASQFGAQFKGQTGSYAWPTAADRGAGFW